MPALDGHPITASAVYTWKSHWRVYPVPPAELILISERNEVRLQGELFHAVGCHIDGVRSVGEITQILQNQGAATEAEVPQAIAVLATHGFIVPSALAGTATATFWNALGYDSQALGHTLGQSHVAIVVLGQLPASRLCADLEAAGIGRAEVVTIDDLAWLLQSDQRPQLTVCLTDDYLNPALADLNTVLAGQPWLLAQTIGVATRLGPLFGTTQDSPCWECLAQRLRFNRPVEQQLASAGVRPLTTGSPGWTPWSIALVNSQICGVVIAALAGTNWPLPTDELWEFDAGCGQKAVHAVVRRPQCPACGRPKSLSDAAARLVLADISMTAGTDGQVRSSSPMDTVAAYRKHVSRVTGVVDDLKAVPNDSATLHVWESGVNLSVANRTANAKGFREKSGGKGTSAEQAQAGALAEAIERLSGMWTAEEPSLPATYQELGQSAIHPNACALYSSRQYELRAVTNPSRKMIHRTPRPFDPAVRMDWTPVWSLTRDSVRWLPTAYCYYQYRGAYPKNGCRADSNGNAAGTSVEDAVLQGFFELVERDAVALWWYNRVRRPAVDLDSFHLDYLDRVREEYDKRLDRRIWVLDLTSDFQVPAFVALSVRQMGPPKPMLGFGAHSSASAGVLRALTEMNQMLAMVDELDAAPPEAVGDPRYPEVTWWRTADPSVDQFLAPLPGAAVTASQFPAPWEGTGREQVVEAQCRVEHLGMEFCVLDQTRPDIGLPVVKVIVPGMRHFWPRFAPGRLFEVPVSLGWCETATAETDLNPLPVFW